MDIDCKEFAKDVRSLDKEMKAWDAFAGLDNTVKNTITSLRAVSELQNPTIRDRHWQQLMQATQVRSRKRPCCRRAGQSCLAVRSAPAVHEGRWQLSSQQMVTQVCVAQTPGTQRDCSAHSQGSRESKQVCSVRGGKHFLCAHLRFSAWHPCKCDSQKTD